MVSGFRWNRSARVVVLAGFAAYTMLAPALAQTPNGSGSPSEQRPTMIIGGTPPPAQPYERCVEVEVGGDSALGCLNQKLGREVDRINPSLNLPPLDARSPDVHVGNANEAAVREQYGSNFGRSAIPYRPPVPTFTSPHR